MQFEQIDEGLAVALLASVQTLHLNGIQVTLSSMNKQLMSRGYVVGANFERTTLEAFVSGYDAARGLPHE